MSEIYPVDDLVWNNRNRGALLRESVLQLPVMDNDQLLATLTLLDDLELDDQLPISHVIGVLFDDKCQWKSLRIGELKAHIYLALGDRENATSWCDWVVSYGGLSQERTRGFRAISTLIQLTNGSESHHPYLQSMGRFLGESEIQIAEQVIAGDLLFWGLTFKAAWEEISVKHKNLITLYNNLRKAKESFL